MEEKPKRQLTEAQRLAFMKGREKRLANIEKRRQAKLEQEEAKPIKEEIVSIINDEKVEEAPVKTKRSVAKRSKKTTDLVQTKEILHDDSAESKTEQDDNKEIETETSTSQDEHVEIEVVVEDNKKPKDIVDITAESKYEIDHDLLADKIVTKMRAFRQQESDIVLPSTNDEDDDNKESKSEVPKKPKLKRASTTKQNETSQSSISKPRLGQPPQIIFNWM